MRIKLLFFLILFSPLSISAQKTYLVTAKNGLFIRENPEINSPKLGKLPWASEVILLNKTDKNHSFTDNLLTITGQWVNVKFTQYPYHSITGYVLNSYLEEKEIIIDKIKKQIQKFPEFNGYSLKENTTPFYLNGDFFNDSTEDIAVLLEDLKGNVRIGFINYGTKNKVYFLGGDNDPFSIDSYNWVGIFSKVPKGTLLWSNYTDDFRAFDDVPENEKIQLSYDAIYIHAAEACGGGFIFWKNGKFNWLQQE